MKSFNLLLRFIKKNKLLKITPLLKGEGKNILLLSDSESIYNCLKLLDGDVPQADFILISNPDFKSHLVLLNNKKPLVCVGYGITEEYEGIIPISVNKSMGINLQMFSYRYILFFRLGSNFEKPHPEITLKKSEDQKNLSLFIKSINGESPMTDELFAWWMNRY